MEALTKIVGQMSKEAAAALETKIKEHYVNAESWRLEVGRLLTEFALGSGWRALGFKSLGAWARHRLPALSKSRIHQLLDYTSVKRDIGEERAISEDALRPLAKIKSPEQRKAAWERAKACTTKKDDEGDPVVTAKHVRAIIDALEEPDHPAPDPPAAAPAKAKAAAKAEPTHPALLAAVLFDSALAAIAKLKAGLTAITESAAGALLAEEAQRLERLRHDMYETVRFCRPFAACVYCKKATGVCAACKGRGWLNEAQAKQAPKKIA